MRRLWFLCKFESVHRQCRGINIQVDDVTKVQHGESIKAKYAKRKGFSKAQDEMNWYINRIKDINKENQKSKPKIASYAAVLRRSARIADLQAIKESNAAIRRSARIAKLQKHKREREHSN